MATPLLALLATLLLATAAYAQHRIPRFTAGPGRVAFTRGVLAAVGVAVGWIAAHYAGQPLDASLAFLAGFGAVHAPAAVILFLKQARGAAKS